MKISVITDTSVTDDAPAPAVAGEPSAADRTVAERAVRRFSFDPMSSPLLAAALAWEAVGARR